MNGHQYSATKKAIDESLPEWKDFEKLHNNRAGINQRDRLQFMQERYTGLKREITIVTCECERRLQVLDTTLKYAWKLEWNPYCRFNQCLEMINSWF